VVHLLGAEALHLDYPTRTVFDGVTVGVSEGDRIGIVGRNGDGKSTLLALLAGRLDPDSGRVTHRRGVTRGLLDQADTLDPALTVAATVVGGVDEHVWARNARVRDVIAGLLADVPWTDPVGTLSGGQRRRVALAALLVGDHDILLLDEPTNHLDIEGIAWLAEHVRSRWSSSGALLVVTHDRWFLDEVTTATWEVHDQKIEPFEGGYASYILQRVERNRLAASSESKRQNLLRKELAWLGRGAPARSTKPKFRMDAALEIIANEPPPRDSIVLAQLATSRLGKDVVNLEGVTVRFPTASGGEKTVLNDVTWRIAPGERTGILGVNGAGKSTLLSLIAGSLNPTTGRVKRGKTARVATLTQQLLELDAIAHERVSAVIERQRTSYVSGGKELSPGQLLERLGFSTAQLSTRITDLSGGQKRRLQLLLILLEEPNVLILDEPTNDLDTDMLAAIEDLLDSWAGTLIVVSHDRYLLERVTDNQYAIIDGALRHLPGGVDEFLALRSANRSDQKSISASGSETVEVKAVRFAELERRGLSGAQRRGAEKELASVDRRIAAVQRERVAAHEGLASHDQSDYVGLEVLLEALRVLQSRESELETRWLELTDALG